MNINNKIYDDSQSEDEQVNEGIKSILDKYGPNIDITGYKDEFKCLEGTSSMKDYVKKDALKFNYEFDYDSYTYYSKLQNSVRINLTKIRKCVADEMFSHKFNIEGYYYELGSIIAQQNQNNYKSQNQYYQDQQGQRNNRYNNRNNNNNNRYNNNYQNQNYNRNNRSGQYQYNKNEYQQ